MQDTSVSSAQRALNQLQEEFAEWRKHKTHTQAKIPAELLEKAHELSHHFDDQTVRQQLGITTRQLQRIKSLRTHPPDVQPNFVEIPQSVDNKPPMTITISLPNGLSVNISGLGTQPISQLVDHIISGYSSC